MIPAEAAEAAGGVLVYHQRRDITSCMCGWSELGRSHAMHQAQLALEAAAPHMLAEVERELTHAKRMIALLVLEAGGKVALSRRAITELSDETVIQTTQDVINGGWVIRTVKPNDAV